MAKVRVMRRNEKGEMEELAAAPQMMTEGLAELIGTELPPVVLEVERGAIRKCAQALGDPNPLYHDVGYARRSGYGDIICPPGFFGFPVKADTLVESLLHLVMDESGLSTDIDVGEEFEFLLPIQAGDVLFSIARIVDIYEEVGKSGKRRLVSIFETTYLNQNGDTVARSRLRDFYF